MNNNQKDHHQQQAQAIHQQNGHGSNVATVRGVPNSEENTIWLNSPTGADKSIIWVPLSMMDENKIGIEVVYIVKLCISQFPEIKTPLEAKIDGMDVTNYDQVRSLAKEFNKALKENAKILEENPTKNQQKEGFFEDIFNLCYDRAIGSNKKVQQLNKYPAFSSQTYGETSFKQMQTIIQELKPNSNDFFIDLGSGVGQLVIHMAGTTQVRRAVGIECGPFPSEVAKKLEDEFKKWMAWFGFPYRPFDLKQGDFMSEEYRRLITEEATIIFINNLAFESLLELRIKRELLSKLKDGTRIISTQAYRSTRNNKRQRYDSDCPDVEVHEMPRCSGDAVSWTSSPVAYYLNIINRQKNNNKSETDNNGSSAVPFPPSPSIIIPITAGNTTPTTIMPGKLFAFPLTNVTTPCKQNNSGLISPIHEPIPSVKTSNSIVGSSAPKQRASSKRKLIYDKEKNTVRTDRLIGMYTEKMPCPSDDARDGINLPKMN